MERNILERLTGEINRGNSGALVTITETSGSVPRRAGAVMAVFANDFQGTIGGGKIEFEVINIARRALETGKSQEFSYKLLPEESLGMSCGGSVKGFIKIFKPKPKLLIAGGGHIGSAINYISKILNFDVTLVDDREELKDEYENIIVGNYGEILKDYPVDSSTYCVIVTKGHRTDDEVLRALVGRGARYIGLIGSRKKSKGIIDGLLQDGFSREEVEKIYTPVGINISDGTPEEIALEILSEILKIKNNGTLVHRRDM